MFTQTRVVCALGKDSCAHIYTLKINEGSATHKGEQGTLGVQSKKSQTDTTAPSYPLTHSRGTRLRNASGSDLKHCPVNPSGTPSPPLSAEGSRRVQSVPIKRKTGVGVMQFLKLLKKKFLKGFPSTLSSSSSPSFYKGVPFPQSLPLRASLP